MISSCFVKCIRRAIWSFVVISIPEPKDRQHHCCFVDCCHFMTGNSDPPFCRPKVHTMRPTYTNHNYSLWTTPVVISLRFGSLLKSNQTTFPQIHTHHYFFDSQIFCWCFIYMLYIRKRSIPNRLSELLSSLHCDIIFSFKLLLGCFRHVYNYCKIEMSWLLLPIPAYLRYMMGGVRCHWWKLRNHFIISIYCRPIQAAHFRLSGGDILFYMLLHILLSF